MDEKSRLLQAWCLTTAPPAQHHHMHLQAGVLDARDPGYTSSFSWFFIIKGSGPIICAEEYTHCQALIH